MDAALLARIDPAIAQKLPNGQLNCLICNAPVKSVKVWTAHINGRSHRENLMKKKNPTATEDIRKQPVSNGQSPVPSRKHKIAVEEDIPSSDRSIFVHPAAKLRRQDVNRLVKESDEEIIVGQTDVQTMEEISEKRQTPWQSSHEVKPVPMVEETKAKEILPEGFFDDPNVDAKVRQVEPKDPLEEEYNRFRKALVEEEHASEVIVEEEEMERQLEREIDEIDRQMSQWSRVHQLEERRDQILAGLGHSAPTVQPKEENSSENFDEPSEDEIDIDDITDWRNKLI